MESSWIKLFLDVKGAKKGPVVQYVPKSKDCSSSFVERDD